MLYFIDQRQNSLYFLQIILADRWIQFFLQKNQRFFLYLSQNVSIF